jgi:hypothetical protein
LGHLTILVLLPDADGCEAACGGETFNLALSTASINLMRINAVPMRGGTLSRPPEGSARNHLDVAQRPRPWKIRNSISAILRQTGRGSLHAAANP